MNNRKCFIRLFLGLSLGWGAMSLNAQTVSKTFKNEPLKTVLKEVENQTGFSIIYKNDELNGSHTVTYTFKDASIEEVLKIILPKNLEFKLQDKMIVISRKASNAHQKPTKKVTGVIVDAEGEPVIGANVLVKGTTKGVITDIAVSYTHLTLPTKLEV